MTKKTYQINTNRGVDLTSSLLNVAPSRASYMRNMINDGGINKKRHGWNEIALFEDVDGNALPINGIWEYAHPDTKDKSLIVYAGTQFFKCDFDFKTQEKISVNGNVNGQKCKAYYKEGLLWIIGCGDYLVYDGTSIVRVENSEYAYAPVTTMNVTPYIIYENDDSVTVEGGHGVTYEDINLLTRKRKNKLIGKTGLHKYASYKLDGKIDFSMPIKVTVDIIPAGTARNENEVSVYAKYKDDGESVIDVVTLTYQTLKYDEKGQLSDYFASCNGKEVLLYTKETENGAEVEKEFDAVVRFFHREDVSTAVFYFPIATYIDGYSNITVEYFAYYERDINLTASAVYTQGNGVDLLLVANRGNAIFYNGLDSKDCEYSFGYIPVEKFITFGSDRDEITAIVPMADGVGIFKGKSFYRVGFTFNADSETYKAEYVPQITVSAESNGCVNQYVCCEVNGDTLTFDGAGVYGIEFASQQRALKLRSSNISKAFEKYTKAELESAVACEHDGRYYLFIGGDVYIGDSRFKVYESNRLDTSFEYEWWVWDNCPASFVCSIDGKLYLGKENGKIAVFDKEYKDRELLVARSFDGDVCCSLDEDHEHWSILTFNESLGVKDGDKIRISGALQQIGWAVPIINYGSFVKIDSYRIDGGYIGKEIIIGNTKCKIDDFDSTDFCFVIKVASFGDTENIYCEIENIEFTLDKILDEDNKVNFYFYNSVGPCCLAEYDDFTITIERADNVECEYHTPALDLGSNLCLKILNQLLITVSNDTEGQIEVGYQTNNDNRFIGRQIGAGLDFGEFNFNNFGFDGGFYKTHIKRVFERNFNYICFKFAARSDKAFGIENFSCIFTTNNKVIRGDR